MKCFFYLSGCVKIWLRMQWIFSLWTTSYISIIFTIWFFQLCISITIKRRNRVIVFLSLNLGKKLILIGSLIPEWFWGKEGTFTPLEIIQILSWFNCNSLEAMFYNLNPWFCTSRIKPSVDWSVLKPPYCESSE